MIEFKALASVTGKPGLFVILKPTRSGVVLESLDEQKMRFIINSNSKVSILREISVYTNDSDNNMPLEKVMTLLYNTYKDDISVSSKSTDAELKAFLKKAMPSYDDSRVYISDIKKLINWYGIILKNEPEIFVPKSEEPISVESENEILTENEPNRAIEKKVVVEEKSVSKEKEPVTEAPKSKSKKSKA